MPCRLDLSGCYTTKEPQVDKSLAAGIRNRPLSRIIYELILSKQVLLLYYRRIDDVHLIPSFVQTRHDRQSVELLRGGNVQEILLGKRNEQASN